MSPVSLAKRTAPTSKGGMERNGADKIERAGKDGFRAANRTTAGSNLPAHAYNPQSGTFHALESGMSDMTGTGAGPNGRYRPFDGDDEAGRGGGASLDNDTLSANGSCSGESAEDQGHGGRMANGGLPAGDKREKVRAKNEKKHQRQKEKRAQDVKDRCISLLTERKLEALAQTLMAMGFGKEIAIAALIIQEGHVERAVSWLLEGGGEESPSENPSEGVVKIDISEELARIAELEIRYGYPRGEIERAVVACEGSLERAASWLRERHPEANSAPLEETSAVSPSPQGPQHGAIAANRSGAQPAPSVPIPGPQLQRQGSGQSANTPEGRRDDRGGVGNIATGTSPMAPLQWPRQQPVHAPSSVVSSTQAAAAVPPARRAAPQSSVGPWKEMEPAKPAAVVAIRGGNAASAQPRQQRPLGPPARYAPPGIAQPSRALLHPSQPLLGATSQGLLPQHIAPPPPAPPLQQAAPLPSTPPLPRPTSGGGTSTPSSYGGSPSLSPSSWSTGVPNSFSPSSVLFNHPTESTWQGTAGVQVVGRPAQKSSLSGEVMQSSQAQQQQPMSNSMASSSMGWGQPLQDVASGPGAGASTSSAMTSGFVAGWGSTVTASSIDWSVSTAGREAADWRMPSSLPGSSGIWGGAIRGITNGFTTAVTLGNEGPGLSSDGGMESRTYDIWSGSFGLSNGGRVPVAEPERTGQEWTSPFAGKDLYVAPRQATLPFSPLPN